MSNCANENMNADRRLVSLAFVGSRWACSRQTCRRILAREGIEALYLGGGGRNATVRFDLEDVQAVEAAAQVGSRDVDEIVRSEVR